MIIINLDGCKKVTDQSDKVFDDNETKVNDVDDKSSSEELSSNEDSSEEEMIINESENDEADEIAPVSFADAESAYMAFLEGRLEAETGAFFIPDEDGYGGFPEGIYNLDRLRAAAAEYNMTGSTVKYSIEDFDSDGNSTLVLLFESNDPSFLSSVFFINYENKSGGAPLSINYSYEYGYRSDAALYKDGSIVISGSNGAGAHGSSIYQVQADGTVVETADMNTFWGSFANSMPYYIPGADTSEVEHTITDDSEIMVSTVTINGKTSFCAGQRAEDGDVAAMEDAFIKEMQGRGAEYISEEDYDLLTGGLYPSGDVVEFTDAGYYGGSNLYLHPYLEVKEDRLFSKDEDFLAYYSYPVVTLSDKDYDSFPKLSEALDEYFRDYSASHDYQKDKFFKTKEREYEELGNKAYKLADRTTEAVVTRGDELAFSIKMIQKYSEYYELTSMMEYGVTFDAASGQQLALTDIIADEDEFIKAVKNSVDTHYGSSPSAKQISSLIDTSLTDLTGIPWSLDNGGVTLYLRGVQNSYPIMLSFDEAGSAIKPQYSRSAADYISPIEAGEGILADLDNDSDSELISLSLVQREDGCCREIAVNIDGRSRKIQTFEEGNDYFLRQAYLIAADSSYKLYLFGNYGAGEDRLAIFDLTGAEVNEVVAFGDSYSNVSDMAFFPFEGENSGKNSLLCDPYYMILGSTPYCIDAVYAYRTYSAYSAYEPIADTPYYIPTAVNRLTLKRDLEADLLDENGDYFTGNTKTAVKGDICYVYRIVPDLGAYLDLLFDDGDIVRVYPDSYSAPDSIGGVPAADIFDGISEYVY
ncbi:hypothetical protein [Butyrivibrio sp. MC2013]|uniref:hypothetical protein n=1 Tax=Butyrivibrio sp. MC2013 TaxID=1280686 RepID=UPI000418750B|nr:hypothetical protein [Butyrivibrio sp. MC2013]